MSEFIESIKHRIRSRMEELKPVVEEAAQLEAMLSAMQPGQTRISSLFSDVTRIAPSGLPELQTQTQTQRVPQSERLNQFIAVAKQNRHSSVAKIAQKLGVSANRGYQLIAALEHAGRIRRGPGGYSFPGGLGLEPDEEPEQVDDKTRVMRLISRRPMIASRDLANALGMPPEKVFYITTELEREGNITRIEGSFMATASSQNL